MVSIAFCSVSNIGAVVSNKFSKNKDKNSFVIASCQELSLADLLCEKLTGERLTVTLGNFADGESIVRLDNIELSGKKVIFVHKFSFVRSINEQLMEILFLIGQLKILKPDSISVVFPYLPYSRQLKDVVSIDSGPLSTLKKLLDSVGVNKIICSDAHEKLDFVDSMEVIDFWENVLLREFRKEELSKFCFLSPDKGGIERARNLAQRFGSVIAITDKKRVGYNKTEVVSIDEKVIGKTVVLVDDMIDSGSTAVKAISKACDMGAKRVFALACHPILSSGAVEKLDKCCVEKVWLCNTVLLDDSRDKVSTKINIVDLDERIVDYLIDYLN